MLVLLKMGYLTPVEEGKYMSASPRQSSSVRGNASPRLNTASKRDATTEGSAALYELGTCMWGGNMDKEGDMKGGREIQAPTLRIASFPSYWGGLDAWVADVQCRCADLVLLLQPL